MKASRWLFVRNWVTWIRGRGVNAWSPDHTCVNLLCARYPIRSAMAIHFPRSVCDAERRAWAGSIVDCVLLKGCEAVHDGTRLFADACAGKRSGQHTMRTRSGPFSNNASDGIVFSHPPIGPLFPPERDSASGYANRWHNVSAAVWFINRRHRERSDRVRMRSPAPRSPCS